MSYNQIYDYLHDKIVRVNINNPKANWGARLLSQHMDLDDLDDNLIEAIETIQMYFHTNNDDNPAGQASLSQVSLVVGGIFLGNSGVTGEGNPWKVDKIRTGDLILEPFIRFGYLEMERVLQKTEDELKDLGYVIKITGRWVELFRVNKKKLTRLSYTDTKPYTKGCRIKGGGPVSLQDRPWRRSAGKLMATPWRINEPVLEAVMDKENKHLFISDRPIESPINYDGEIDPFLELKKQQRISKETDFLIVTSKAEALVGKDFYQEMEADYRGRLYYNEPFLNFQGSDLARGIFLFAEGKPMTEEGKWWLAVHTAATYNMSYDIDEIPSWCEADYKSYLENEGLDSISVDKFTLEDRVRWTNEYMEVILQAGTDRLFAEDAEKKVSFLAACIEWVALWDATSNGRVHVSHLPVGIDGSNNGWQHLGAISKDTRTGELVGLVPTSIPRDFYVQTAKQLLEIDDPKLNAMPMKHVRKGISKRGSMTRAYSAGAEKIGKNMWFDCRSAEFDDKYDITEEDCEKWAVDLIKAIDKVCPGPLSTMKYMQELIVHHLGSFIKYKDGKPAAEEYTAVTKEMKEIWDKKRKNWTDEERERYLFLQDSLKDYESVLVSGNGARNASWITPSGFPVNYEAFKTEKFKCRGTINGKQIKHVLHTFTDYPDIHKFMCGISPNYIHSQDASHMALVIDKWHGTFGAVHDSFATHASDIEEMLGLTKDVFVDMYDVDNYLDKIREDITGSTDTTQQPKLGSLRIQEVYDSDHFFS